MCSLQLDTQLEVFPFAHPVWLWAWWIMLQYSTVANHSDTLQQSLAVAFYQHKAESLCPAERATSHNCAAVLWSFAPYKKKGTRTQGEDVGATGPGHMVLLDGLVERGLAEQQEAKANPHDQQPGHGEGRVCRMARSRTGGNSRKTGKRVHFSMSPYIFTTHILYLFWREGYKIFYDNILED